MKIKNQLHNNIYILYIIPAPNMINYCSIKYHNFLTGTNYNILNNNNNNIKIDFTTDNNAFKL